MSLRTHVPMIAVVLLALSAAGVRADEGAQQLRAGDEFRAAGLALPVPVFLLDHKSADVTGDGVVDAVFLVGAKERTDDAYSRETWLVIRDGETEEHATARPGPLTGGYGGEMFLGDFTGDGLADILTGLPSGGSSGTVNYSLMSCRDHQPTVLFDQERLTRGPQYSVRFKDGFEASVFNKELARTFDVSVSAAKNRYMEAGIYDAGGTLLRKTTGLVDPYSLIQPRDSDADGVYNLVGFQRVWGVSHADTIGIARSVWRWAGTKWKLADVRVAAPELFFAGVYEACISSASRPDRMLRLTLRLDGTSEMVDGSAGQQPAVTTFGTWGRNDDGTITVSLAKEGDRRASQAQIFRVQGDLLIAENSDQPAPSPGGLTFLRTVDAFSSPVLPSPGALAPPQTFRGHLILGHEVRAFTACGSEESVWVRDETGELWEIYESLAVEPYERIFTEVKGRMASPPADGFGRDYTGQLHVTKVHRAAREGRGCDDDLGEIAFDARGNEPFWHVTISENRIGFFELSGSQMAFPAVPAARGPGRWIYYTSVEQPEKHWLLIVIDEKPCVDSMSGEYFGFTAEVILDGERYVGCAAKGLLATD